MNKLIPRERIEQKIFLIRKQKVILDADLALLYGVPTKRLNEQVKRNPERFPEDFIFRLTREETASLVGVPKLQTVGMDRSQIATGSHKHRNPAYLPYAFTEHGALMAANVLNSTQAVRMSVFVVRAFVKLREQIMTTQMTDKRLAEIEKKLLTHDVCLSDLYRKIKPLLLPPPKPPGRRIGFHTEPG